ncbi:MAG TPA: diacylglycerol kinase family protein, partial [Fibrella sp.]
MQTLLFLNEAANNEAGGRKWDSIAKAVLARLPADAEVIRYRPGFDLEALLRPRLKTGQEYALLSAGGDGSLHHLLNTLIRIGGESCPDVYLGGIGLGSSNDFYKPVQQAIQGVPVRIDPTKTIQTDVGRVRYEQPDGQFQTRYFLINASLGITAQANHLFNEGDWFIRPMKNRWVGLTIQYTALKTILTYKDQSLRLGFDDGPVESLQLTNLNLLKNPHVSGSFRYEQA